MKHDMPATAALDELARRNVPAHQERGSIVASLTGETIATANRWGDVRSRDVLAFVGA